MYETHFGFSGPPFQLNPDPAFYFDSRGHSNALSYLKFGAHQGEGFIVVTGEIGAGKTTLVRTLLESLDPAHLVAAQIVSTQLEAGDLLRTILTAFGIPPSGASKAHLISTLEGFLTAVAAKGRRALLIVDEAQNLDRGAVEELRMLSNFQLGNQGLLQSFLIGQPELRVLLQSKSMEQLRQRVIASCHLGPLDLAETRAYIEHRLRHVGWVANPAFDDDAHERIHHWSSGIPRRINRLCNRLLLGAFLADGGSISAESVDRTALDLGSEIGETMLVPAPAANLPRPSAPGGVAVAQRADDEAPVERRSRGEAKPGEPLLCLVDTVADYLRAGALSQAFAEHPSLPPVIAVHMGSMADLSLGLDISGVPSLPALDIHINVGHRSGAARAALALTRFDALVDEFAPVAVLALGSSDAVLACSMLANKREIAVLRHSAGRRRAWAAPSDETNALLIEQFADVLYTDSLATHYVLHRLGIASDRVQCVGDLARNVVRLAHASAPDHATLQARTGFANSQFNVEKGFALVTKQFRPLHTNPAQVMEAVSMLAVARTETPLLWAVDGGTLLELKANGADVQLKSLGISLSSELGYLDCIALLGRARCVIAGSDALFVDEAAALGVASVVAEGAMVVPVKVAEAAAPGVPHGIHQLRKLVHDIVNGAQRQSDAADYWDGGAGLRIANHLGPWLRKHSRTRTHLRVAVPDAEQQMHIRLVTSHQAAAKPAQVNPAR